MKSSQTGRIKVLTIVDDFTKESVDLVGAEARIRIAAWRRDYNEHRPHSALNYQTPAEFAGTTNGGASVRRN